MMEVASIAVKIFQVIATWIKGRFGGVEPLHHLLVLHHDFTDIKASLGMSLTVAEHYYEAIHSDEEWGADDFVILRECFEQFNIDEPATDIGREYRQLGNRSLSVGDVVVIRGRAYLCAPVGWTPLEEIPRYTKTPHEATRSASHERVMALRTNAG